MDKKEILEKAQSKKALVGEMEKTKVNKSCWIANIVSCICATIFMIVLGMLKNFVGLYSIAFICNIWGSIFYFCQYFIAKMPWQVLIGAILCCIGAIIMLNFFIIFSI